MVNWQLEHIAIKNLKPHPKNPRKITKDQMKHLEVLIQKFGMIDKPVVNKDFTIIGGHQRIAILKKMKEKYVDCWIADQQIPQEDVDHLCIGLNLNQGSFDYEILGNEWEMLDLIKWGFTEDQLVGACKELEDEIAALDKKDKKNKQQQCPKCGYEF